MQLWTAFLLGLVGSAHCAGMCGPLTLALPGAADRATLVLGRLLYNFGRIVTYTLMGAVFGLLGHGFALAGLQRWLSLFIGGVILIGVIAAPRFANALPLLGLVAKLKMALGRLFKLHGVGALFGIGLLNGLLPCGLVYVAGAAATTQGEALASMKYMAAFGLGTTPMLFVLALAGHRLGFVLRFRLQRLIPVSLAIVGTLLLLRGMALGIPYVSPRLPAQPVASASCH